MIEGALVFQSFATAKTINMLGAVLTDCGETKREIRMDRVGILDGGSNIVMTKNAGRPGLERASRSALAEAESDVTGQDDPSLIVFT